MLVTIGDVRRQVRVLLEYTRADKEGVSTEDIGQTLAKYVDVGYMTFSYVNKLGINPRTHFKTPVGIYTYPITAGIVDQYVNSIQRHPRSTKPQASTNKLPFGQERPFIHVMVPRDPSKVVDISSVGPEEALELAHRVDKVDGRKLVSMKRFMKLTDTALIKTPGGRLWYYTIPVGARGEADFYGTVEVKDPMGWRKLWMSIGVDGVVDHGTGVIHKNEPTQAVFFSLGAVEHVTTVSNPSAKKETGKREVRKNIEKQYQTIAGFKRLYKFFNDARASGYSTYDDVVKLALDTNIESPYPYSQGAIIHSMGEIIKMGWFKRMFDNFNKANDVKSFLKLSVPGILHQLQIV